METKGNSAFSNELRPLGILEKWFWLMDQHSSSHFGIVAQFEGIVSIEKWQNALDRLQARHPFLRARIGASAAGRLAFLSAPEQQLVLTAKDRITPEAWIDEIVRQLGRSFDPASTALMRAIVLQDSDYSDLLLIFHPSVADAVSTVAVLQDIMLALADGELPPLDIPPDLGTLFASICPEYREGLKALDDGPILSYLKEDPTSSRQHRGAVPKIDQYRMTNAETEILLATVETERTNVLAAVCAALVLAGWGKHEPESGRQVGIFSSFDLRSRLGISSGLMTALSVGMFKASPSATSQVWEFSRSIAESLTTTRTDEHVVQTASAFGLAVQYSPTPARLAAFCDQSFPFELLISSLDEVCLHPGPEALKLVSLWGPAILIGPPAEQSIGMGVIHGQLHLLHTSYEPIPALLSDAVSILRIACDLPEANPSRFK